MDQLWAEAVVRWRAGEALFITGAVENTAKAVQESHRETSAREGVVLDFIERPVPGGLEQLGAGQAPKMFWGGSFVETDSLTLAPRDRVCALEVWCEALDGRQKDMTYSDAVEINGILENAPGWARSKKSLRCGYCGVQRGFVRKPL